MRASAVIRTVSLAAVITFAATLAAAAPPPAKGLKVNITAPTTATTATIQITKSSQAQVSVGSGVVTFKLKVAGVLDNTSMPATEAANTATFTFLVPGGMLRNKDFPLDIVAGKGAFKIGIPLSDAGTWGSMLVPGQPIELRQVRLTENSTGDLFGVSGLTTK